MLKQKLRSMVGADGDYLALNYLNDLTASIPFQNRMRRMERCELFHDVTLEVHCVRFDLLLGCAPYLTPTISRDMLQTAGKTYGYMIRG